MYTYIHTHKHNKYRYELLINQELVRKMAHCLEHLLLLQKT